MRHTCSMPSCRIIRLQVPARKRHSPGYTSPGTAGSVHSVTPRSHSTHGSDGSTAPGSVAARAERSSLRPAIRRYFCRAKVTGITTWRRRPRGALNVRALDASNDAAHHFVSEAAASAGGGREHLAVGSNLGGDAHRSLRDRGCSRDPCCNKRGNPPPCPPRRGRRWRPMPPRTSAPPTLALPSGPLTFAA